MKRLVVCWLLLAALPARAEERFSGVDIEKPFAAYLLSNPLLMEVTGTKVIRIEDGRRALVAVASTVVKDATPQDRLRAEKVCRIKALAGVVAEKQGIQVSHVEKLEERTVVVLDGGKETGKSVSELLEVTRTRVEGVARDMPVVGRWKSGDGKIFYLALGVILDKK